MSQNPYDVLGVQPSADLKTIEEAFRRLNQSLDPSGRPEDCIDERLEEVRWAYGFLSDPDKRAKYDALTRRVWPTTATAHKPWQGQKNRPQHEVQPIDAGLRVTISTCEFCGKIAPVQYSSFNQNIGFVFTHRHDCVEGDLCRDCIEYLFWRMTATTLLLGWWGLISMLVTPGILLGNLTSYMEARELGRGRGAMPTGIRFWKYFTLLAVIGIAFLLIVFVKAVFFH